MTLPKPDTLGSTISDVVAVLPSEDKISVLLYAMECLPMDVNSRDVIEVGVESFLQAPVKFQDREKSIRARLLRANSRIKGGLRDAACQDIQAILILDPDHCKARELLTHYDGEFPTGSSNAASMSQDSNRHVKKSPHLPLEIWGEIASFLSRRDLRSLVSLPHALSPIARQFLFRDVFLQFGTGELGMEHKICLPSDPREMDKWHAQRSAEILCKLISDPACANQVRSLSVCAPEDSGNALFPFFMVMLGNVLTKLSNLKVFKCRMNNDTLTPVLGILEKSHPGLEGLVITTTSSTPPPLPKLGRLKCFAFKGAHEDLETIPDVQFLTTQSVALRTLVIDADGCLPRPWPEHPLCIGNLRNLTLCITIPYARFLDQLLESSQKLESLQLVVCPGGNILSTVFRAHSAPGSFPILREFSFVLSELGEIDEEDPDLFPAVAEVVRGQPMLEALCLSYRASTWDPLEFGYNSAIWGVVPRLVHLRSLSMDIPEDLPSALCGWLVPPTVVALKLGLPPDATWDVDYSQLLPGLPRGLKFLDADSLDDDDISDDVLPALHLVNSLGSMKVVYDTEHGRQFEDLGPRQEAFYLEDWLRQLNCEEANFLYSDICGFRHGG